MSADSRQIYRYMDIGTAKPSRQEQEAVSHYMLDLVEPSDVYSAKRYADEGRRVLKKIAFGKRVAFVVGDEHQVKERSFAALRMTGEGRVQIDTYIAFIVLIR